MVIKFKDSGASFAFAVTIIDISLINWPDIDTVYWVFLQRYDGFGAHHPWNFATYKDFRCVCESTTAPYDAGTLQELVDTVQFHWIWEFWDRKVNILCKVGTKCI